MRVFHKTKRQAGKVWLAGVITLLVYGVAYGPVANSAEGEIDPSSGFIIKPGFEMVRAHCTACHSGRLVTQNHMSRERWLSTIRWMQKTQNLWPLPQEDEILDYLSAHYGERTVGRRAPLPNDLMPKIRR